MADLNSNGLLIATIIIYIIFFISIIIIINEIINITIFCYKYTYLYNYGNLNEKNCLNDETTSILEYEKARFRIYNIINNYKLKNDLFNKNWINYISYLSILLLTIIICIGFGILFKNYFIETNNECIKTPKDEDASFLKQLMLCFFSDYARNIPNCSVNYTMIFIIIVIYPLIYLLKVFFNIDFTSTGGYWTKINHMIFFILLLYYAVVLFNISEENKTVKLTIYLSYVIIFYIAYFVFNYTYDDYNRSDKVGNIYNYEKNTSSTIVQNDKNDTMFFDIYKQTAPLKPTMPLDLQTPPVDDDGNDLLSTFKYLTAKELKFIETMIGVIAAGFDFEDANGNVQKARGTIDKYCMEIGDLLSKNGRDIIDTILSKYFKHIDGRYEPTDEAVHYYVYLAYIKLLNKNNREPTNDEYGNAIDIAEKLVGKPIFVNRTSRNTKTIIINTFKEVYRYATEASTQEDDNKYTGSVAQSSDLRNVFIKNSVINQKGKFRLLYQRNLTKINNYYKAKKDYDDELDNYNRKYNIFKNTNVEFPKLIFILYDICPKLFGLDKKIVIMIIVAIICFIIIYYALNSYYSNVSNDINYLYNTILIYLIGIISIFIISNSVLTYNTYFNKYLIYEPIVQYKYDLNNLNTIFNISLDNNTTSKKSKVDFYKTITNSKDTLINITGISTATPISTYIDNINNNVFTNATAAIIGLGTDIGGQSTTIVADTVTIPPSSTYSATNLDYKKSTIVASSNITDVIVIKILRRAMFSVLYSASIDLTLRNDVAVGNYLIYSPTDANKYNPLYIPYTNWYNTNLNKFYEGVGGYNLIANSNIVTTALTSSTVAVAGLPARIHIASMLKTFFLMIKKTFIGDASKIDDRINIIRRNLKYIIYTETEIDRVITVINSNDAFYKTFLSDKNYSQEDLDKINFANFADYKVVIEYNRNMAGIENILNQYAKYILEFRTKIVELFNSVGYCNTNSIINIDQKLNDYYGKVFIKNNKSTDDKYLIYDFKIKTDEPFIDIYKNKLLQSMKSINELFVKNFNIIKFLTLYTISSSANTYNQTNIISEIKNNYNVFNKDNNKYNESDLLMRPFKLQCNYINKFSNFSLKDKTEQEINMNNVSWSFIILVIIFAVILLEPTII